MLKLWHYYLFQNKLYFIKDREQGFTLIELLLSLAISSILFLSFYSILKFTTNTCKIGEEIDELMLNGQYAIEYIKKEIRQAEKIISIEQIEGLNEKYPNNIGFVIMRHSPEKEYNYSTYYLKNNKIYRIAINKSDANLPRFSDFSGHNILAEHVVSIGDSNINFKTKTVDLQFIFKGVLGEEIVFKTKTFIRCPIIY